MIHVCVLKLFIIATKMFNVVYCIFLLRAPRARASSSGGNGMNTQVSGADGIYLNETFMHRVTSLIGLEVEVRIKYTFFFFLYTTFNNFFFFR